MSLFPYNNRQKNEYGAQGSPLHYDDAQKLAYDLFWWHTQIAETDNWTQSAEAAEHEIDDIALGLMTMFAEPAFIQMLESVGKDAWERIRTLRALRKSGHKPTDADGALHTVGIETVP